MQENTPLGIGQTINVVIHDHLGVFNNELFRAEHSWETKKDFHTWCEVVSNTMKGLACSIRITSTDHRLIPVYAEVAGRFWKPAICQLAVPAGHLGVPNQEPAPVESEE